MISEDRFNNEGSLYHVVAVVVVVVVVMLFIKKRLREAQTADELMDGETDGRRDKRIERQTGIKTNKDGLTSNIRKRFTAEWEDT